jgi:uncharacterized protein YfcZ (UPF0381/DUF406 family)
MEAQTAMETHIAGARMDVKLIEKKRAFTSVMAVLEEWNHLEKAINKLDAKLEQVEKERMTLDTNLEEEEEKVRMEELLVRKAVLVKAKESVDEKVRVLRIAMQWLQ